MILIVQLMLVVVLNFANASTDKFNEDWDTYIQSLASDSTAQQSDLLTCTALRQEVRQMLIEKYNRDMAPSQFTRFIPWKRLHVGGWPEHLKTRHVSHLGIEDLLLLKSSMERIRFEPLFKGQETVRRRQPSKFYEANKELYEQIRAVLLELDLCICKTSKRIDWICLRSFVPELELKGKDVRHWSIEDRQKLSQLVLNTFIPQARSHSFDRAGRHETSTQLEDSALPTVTYDSTDDEALRHEIYVSLLVKYKTAMGFQDSAHIKLINWNEIKVSGWPPQIHTFNIQIIGGQMLRHLRADLDKIEFTRKIRVGSENLKVLIDLRDILLKLNDCINETRMSINWPCLREKFPEFQGLTSSHYPRWTSEDRELIRNFILEALNEPEQNQSSKKIKLN